MGDRFIAAVAAPAPEEVLNALSEAASDARLALETLVGLVPSGRVDPVESFGLVWWPEAAAAASTSVTAVVRGDAVVDLASPGGSRRFDARGIRPWHLADFDDVVALRITDAATPLEREQTPGEPVVPRRASLRASSIGWTAVAGSQADAPAATPWLDADTLLAPRQREADLGASVADTVITPRQVRRVPEHPGASPTDSPTDSPASPTGTAADPALNGPRFRIGDGQPVTITAPVLIGRRPLPPRIASSGMPPELLTVESPAAIVSGTHLELRVVGSRLVATDLHSTNGTVLRTLSGTRRLRAGESVVVLPGTRLDLGDDTIIEILLAQGSPGA